MYLPLFEVTDTHVHIQRDDMSNCLNISEYLTRPCKQTFVKAGLELTEKLDNDHSTLLI